jgi:hypothetical protein
MDRIDHDCLWIIKICLVILFLTLPLAVESLEEDNKGHSDFFFACSGGKLEGVKKAIEAHSSEYIYVLTCHVCSSTPQDETTDSGFIVFVLFAFSVFQLGSMLRPTMEYPVSI